MKLEYFPDSADGPVVLIYGTDPAGLASLLHAFEDLASGELTSVALHELPGIESVDQCRVLAATTSKGDGLRAASDLGFRWRLPILGWEGVAALVEPFTSPKAAKGVPAQYLSDEGEATVILSTARQWQ